MEIIILAGACIVLNNKTLLLKQNTNTKRAGLWGPPGGHREGSESLIETAIREAKEETNLDVEIIGLVQGGIKTRSNGISHLILLYYALPSNPEEIRLDKSENVEYKWVTLEEINADKFPLRDIILKPMLIKALTEKPLPLDAFKIFPE